MEMSHDCQVPPAMLIAFYVDEGKQASGLERSYSDDADSVDRDPAADPIST